MSKDIIAELRDTVTEAVRETGSYALNCIGNYGEIRDKSSRDFVTEIDEKAERRIIRGITERFPDAEFYGEETGRQGSGRYLFVIDPIDATTNYIKGINGERIHVSDISELGRSVVGWNRSNHPPEIIESSKRVLAKIIDQAATFRVFRTGSLDYCYLAKGSFDACITPLAEPFHSAGYIIMEEAGAKVTDYYGRPPSLESKTIIAGNPEWYPEILSLVTDTKTD